MVGSISTALAVVDSFFAQSGFISRCHFSSVSRPANCSIVDDFVATLAVEVFEVFERFKDHTRVSDVSFEGFVQFIPASAVACGPGS